MRKLLCGAVLILAGSLAPPAAAETLASCRQLIDGAERLACYDGLGPAAVDPEALLLTLLGDPEAGGKEYGVFGNSAAVFRMLPGRWVVGPWKDIRPMVGGGEGFQKACAKGFLEIAASATDPYSLSVTRQQPKKGAFHLRDIILASRWRLAEAQRLGDTLEFLGLKPEAQGWDPARFIFLRPVSFATYLPLTPDIVLTIESASGEIGLMLRCPAA